MALPNCEQKYDFFDEATGGCTPCVILCEPKRNRLEECQNRCKEYYQDHMQEVLPPDPPSCPPDSFRDEAVGMCSSCAPLCDYNKGLDADCQYFCPEYARTHFGVTTPGGSTTLLGEETNSSDGLAAWVIPTIACLSVLVVLIIIVVALVAFRRLRHKQKKRSRRADQDQQTEEEELFASNLSSMDLELQENAVKAYGDYSYANRQYSEREGLLNNHSSQQPQAQCAIRDHAVKAHKANHANGHEVSASALVAAGNSDFPGGRQVSSGGIPQPHTSDEPAVHPEPLEQPTDRRVALQAHTEDTDKVLNPRFQTENKAVDKTHNSSDNTTVKEIDAPDEHTSCNNNAREFQHLQGKCSGRTGPLSADVTSAQMHVEGTVNESTGRRTHCSQSPAPSASGQRQGPSLSLDSIGLNPSINSSHVSSVAIDDDDSGRAASAPVVSLAVSLDRVPPVAGAEGPYFAWDVMAPQEDGPGEPSVERNALSTADYEYLDKQKWVRIIMTAEKKLEIMVKGINSKQAKRNILDNTGLHSSRLYVTTLNSENFRYLNGDDKLRIKQVVHFQGQHPSNNGERCVISSMVAGFLDNRAEGTITYMITSGHYSFVGAEYYSDSDMQEKHYLGECTHCFFEDVFGDKLDIAFVKLEPHITREQLYNLLALPCGQPMEFKDFMPELYKEDIQHLEDNAEGLLKHSKSMIRGKFAKVKDDGVHQFALVTEMFKSGTCLPGDSGSLITALPERLGCQGRMLSSLGVVAGLKTLDRSDGDTPLVTEACIFTSLWPALKRVAEESHLDLNSFRFVPPITFGDAVDVPATTSIPPISNRDSGYPVTAPR